MRTAKRRELIPDGLYVERMLHESAASCERSGER